MPDKKHMMNDMIVTKKTVVKKQVLEVPQKFEIQPVSEQEDPVVFKSYENPVRNRSGCFLWIIAMICITALGMGIGGLFTYTKVAVTPKQFSGTVDKMYTLTQSRNTDGVFFATATKTFTSEKVIPITGRAPSEAQASGTVRLYNTHTSAKTISAKTEIISSAGKKYLISKTVTIPPKGLKDPGQIDVGVIAKDAGIYGNSALDDFTFSKTSKTLEGVTIRSVTEITGGSDDLDAIADPEMITRAAEDLKNEFSRTETLIARLSEQVPDTMIALPLTLPENPVTIVLDPKHEDGVHVIANQTVTILLVHRSEIARIIGDSLGVEKNIKLTLKNFEDLSILTSAIVAGQPIPQKIQIRITGTGTVVGLLDTQKIKEAILGISRKEARSSMDQIPEIATYKLQVQPFWRRILPRNPHQLEVVAL